MGYGRKDPQTIHIDNPNVDALTSQLAQNTKKLNGVINLAEWNLYLDGVNSDRPALVAAIELWKTIGGKIKLPMGTLYLDTDVELPDGIIIEGTGLNKTILKTSNVTGAFKNTNVAKFVTLRDFMILASSGGSTGIGLDTTNIGNSNFENIYISGFAGGVRLSNSTGNVCYYNTFIAVRAENCKIGWDINTDANGNNFIGCRAIQCETGISLDVRAGGNTFSAFGIEVYTTLTNPAYGVKFGAGVEGNTFSGCRIEITGQGESLYCTDVTADYNIVIGSTIYTQNPLSGGGSYKGFSGTGGYNNSVINGKTPTTLKGVTSIDGVASTLSTISFNGRNKTPNGDAFRFFAYKADLTTLFQVMAITGGTDAPTVRLPYEVTLDAQGYFKFYRDAEGTKNGGGVILRSPDGLTKKKLTIDNTGNPIWTTVP